MTDAADRGTDPERVGTRERIGTGEAAEPPPARSLLERLGLAAVAIVMAIVFGGLALAAWIGGEVFLAVMAGTGALMTIWAAVANLRRG